MKKTVEALIKSYKLDVEGCTEYNSDVKNEISIQEGNNEGYYINITKNFKTISLRLHDKNEAIKTLGIMIQFI